MRAGVTWGLVPHEAGVTWGLVSHGDWCYMGTGVTWELVPNGDWCHGDWCRMGSVSHGASATVAPHKLCSTATTYYNLAQYS